MDLVKIVSYLGKRVGQNRNHPPPRVGARGESRATDRRTRCSLAAAFPQGGTGGTGGTGWGGLVKRACSLSRSLARSLSLSLSLAAPPACSNCAHINYFRKQSKVQERYTTATQLEKYRIVLGPSPAEKGHVLGFKAVSQVCRPPGISG